jgi:class 3 adenylate cyclase
MEAELKDGVVLLVDISGFTRLSDQFQGLGQEGIDSLTSTINRMFTTIIEHVEAWGGDIVKFAGQNNTCISAHLESACQTLESMILASNSPGEILD